jgi:hypothetical protein
VASQKPIKKGPRLKIIITNLMVLEEGVKGEKYIKLKRIQSLAR